MNKVYQYLLVIDPFMVTMLDEFVSEETYLKVVGNGDDCASAVVIDSYFKTKAELMSRKNMYFEGDEYFIKDIYGKLYYPAKVLSKDEVVDLFK